MHNADMHPPAEIVPDLELDLGLDTTLQRVHPKENA